MNVLASAVCLIRCCKSGRRINKAPGCLNSISVVISVLAALLLAADVVGSNVAASEVKVDCCCMPEDLGLSDSS